MTVALTIPNVTKKVVNIVPMNAKTIVAANAIMTERNMTGIKDVNYIMATDKGAWHIRAGVRTELDKRVRAIMATLPPDANESEFIKECIVKSRGLEDPKKANDEVAALKEEISHIKQEVKQLIVKLSDDIFCNRSTEVLGEDLRKINEAKDRLKALEGDW